MTTRSTTIHKQATEPRETPTPTLTRREFAELGGIPLAAINKAVEQRVVEVQRGPRRSVELAISELPALVLMHQTGVALPVSTKRRVRNWVIENQTPSRRRQRDLEIAPGLFIRYAQTYGELVKKASRYSKLRDKYIEIDPEVKGGAPVIRDTRLTASAVHARLAGGDSIESLQEDYPDIEPEAFEIADLYARTHPRRGRPPRPQPARA